MKVVSIIFAMVCVLLLLHFGIASVSDIADNTNITINDSNYESYNTAVNTTGNVFVVANTIPYILVLVGVITGLLLLTKLI